MSNARDEMKKSIDKIMNYIKKFDKKTQKSLNSRLRLHSFLVSKDKKIYKTMNNLVDRIGYQVIIDYDDYVKKSEYLKLLLADSFVVFVVIVSVALEQALDG